MKLIEDQIRGLLQARRLRPTRARMQILEILNRKMNHLSADEIIGSLQKSGDKVSAATIYQNLAKLADTGLLVRIAGADGMVHFDANLSPHHHLICKKCGRIEDVKLAGRRLPRLNPMSRGPGSALAGWKLEELQVEFKSVCPRCRRRR